MHCNQCGNPNQPEACYCRNCGTPLRVPTAGESPVLIVTVMAMVLAIMSLFCGFLLAAPAMILSFISLFMPRQPEEKPLLIVSFLAIAVSAVQFLILLIAMIMIVIGLLNQ